MSYKLFFLAAFFFATACAKTVEPPAVVETPQAQVGETEKQPRPDFDAAVRTLIKHLAKSGVLKPVDGGKNKILMTRVVDKTAQKVNVAEIQSVIKREMTKTGKIAFIDGKGDAKRPDFALSGKVTSRIANIRGEERTEFYLYLALSESKTGVVFWENQTPVLMTGK